MATGLMVHLSETVSNLVSYNAKFSVVENYFMPTYISIIMQRIDKLLNWDFDLLSSI